jgi:magnesium and cobalt transporter
LAGKIPQRGEQLDHPGGITFEVLEADPRHIMRVGLRLSATSHARAPQ